MPQPVAIITGASAGIGFEAARKLCSNGLVVYAGARRVDRMEPLKVLGVNVLALDVTDDESMRAAVGRVVAERGHINGPHAAQGQHMAGVLASVDREQASTHPEVIARAVLHAATSARLRTRYPVGSGAGAIPALRRLLSDRLYDVLVTAVLKRVAG
jgi:NADP-dependent 3-hydroxy acid dehydrogenase YdfG